MNKIYTIIKTMLKLQNNTVNMIVYYNKQYKLNKMKIEVKVQPKILI